jgi:hypothetical protein
MTQPKPKASAPKPTVDSRVSLVHVGGELLCRFAVIVTACLVVLMTTMVWLLQGFLDKKFVDVRDLMIVAGLGFSTIIGTYFKPIKKTSR